VLVVGVQLYHPSASRSVSSVTFNGVAMTAGPTIETNSGGERDRAALFYLVNPPAGEFDIAVTPSGSGTTISIAAAQFSNINQTSPVGNTGTARAGPSNARTAWSTRPRRRGRRSRHSASPIWCRCSISSRAAPRSTRRHKPSVAPRWLRGSVRSARRARQKVQDGP